MRTVHGGFDDEFPHLYRAAFRAAHRLTRDVPAAEDAASEALARAGLRWRRIADHALPWVVRVATNLALDDLRRDRHRRAERTVVLADDGGVDAALTASDLAAALATLPTRQREVIVLRYLGDLSEQEIADELGIAPGTVKSHAHRGLEALRARLDDRHDLTPARPEEQP